VSCPTKSGHLSPASPTSSTLPFRMRRRRPPAAVEYSRGVAMGASASHRANMARAERRGEEREGAFSRHRLAFARAFVCVTSLALTACTRSLVPLLTVAPPTPPSPTVLPTAIVEPGPTLRPTVAISAGVAYAVAWVPGDQTLAVRQPAGTSGSKIDELSSDQRGIQLTGNSTLLGSSMWVEIVRTGGGTGWVNSWNLTEAVSASEFCADSRVQALIDKVESALRERDGHALAELVNPRRGLVIRVDWWNPDVIVPYPGLTNLFTSPTVIEWGIEQESDKPVEGTFRETVLPGLDDVMDASPTVSCDSLNAGKTARSVQWPDEFTNLNFYSFFRPPNVPGNELSWRAWAMGIEYVGGEPYLSLLVQYRAEI
jgi:hypothetical protein